MIIPYRIRRVLRRISLTALAVLSFALALTICWFLWLQRYVVYTDDGVKLMFGMSMELPDGELAKEPTQGDAIDFIYKDDLSNTGSAAKELAHFNGYYIDLAAMREDFNNVLSQVQLLPQDATVMLDMKNKQGEFYYSSGLGHMATDVNLDQVAALINQLKEKDCYLIARIPAFQDRNYFLDDERGRVPFGLPREGGNGSLWLDKEHSCYWFNPASDGTITFLIQVVSELRALGFHEVILNDFRFPRTDMIYFRGNQEDALNKAAATLVNTCATDTFAVSFVREAVDLKIPEGRTRLYLLGASAADAANLAAQTGFADPSISLGFFADTNDTRFNAYNVLRPIDMAR